MEWNQELFYNNIKQIIKICCNGKALAFNEKIKSRDAATRWRNKKPSINSIATIIHVFGVSIDWLVEGQGEMFAKEESSGEDAAYWRDKYLECVETLNRVLLEHRDAKGKG